MTKKQITAIASLFVPFGLVLMMVCGYLAVDNIRAGDWEGLGFDVLLFVVNAVLFGMNLRLVLR